MSNARASTSAFTEEYKRQAAELVVSSGRSITAVGKELGLRDSVLRRWVEKLRRTRLRRSPGCARRTSGCRGLALPGGYHGLFSRKIVGWAMRDHMQVELAASALTMAIRQQHPQAGLIHHSDRGVQYASQDYRAVLSTAGIAASMSRKADCYDNAPMESFFHTLKTELVRANITPGPKPSATSSASSWDSTIEPDSISAIGYIAPIEMELKTA